MYLICVFVRISFVFRKIVRNFGGKTYNETVMAEYRLIKDFPGMETCLECGTAFYGRANRKFCCEACKNRYHNKRYQDIRNTKLRVRNTLERNYRILTGLLSENRLSADIAELSLLGYSPGYVTSYHKAGSRMQCSCYDIVFTVTAGKICRIHRTARIDVPAL